ncbi:histidine kinase N-terminal 7TM domain-containing protein [Methanobacterium aggregans]|uniref:histidine kinase N-terminal 7TM domain-containing protein n=1 Tax=Methanobacterium aggregans TaxID=1615586 RepID=UPI00320D10A9
MALQYTAYTALLLFTTCLNIFLAWNIWKRRGISGSIYLFFIILAASLWSFTGALELASTSIGSKIFWGKISYIGITTVAPLWFLFTVTYSKNQLKVKRQHIILLLIIPALTTLLAFTNEMHGLVWPGFGYLETSAGLIIIYKHGVAAITSSIYSYALMIMGLIVIGQNLFREPSIYKQRGFLMVLAALIPLLSNLIYALGVSPFYFDPTPLALTLTGILVFWSLFHYKLFDLVPPAYETLFSNMKSGVMVLDLNGTIVDVNGSAQNLIGVAASSVGENVGDQLDIWDEIRPHEDRIDGKIELELQKSENVFLEIRYNQIYTERIPSGWLYIFEDISDRKIAEKALKKSEAHYRTIFENTGTAILILESDATISLANAEFQELTGFKIHDVENKMKILDFISEKDKNTVINYHHLRRSPHGLAPRNYEFSFKNVEGKIKHALATVSVIADTDKSVASLMDITELKETERALKESEKKYREFADMLPQTVFETNKNGNITFFNEHAFKMFGYSPEDLNNGLNILEIINENDRQRSIDKFDKISQGDLSGDEYTAKHADGSRFPIILHSTPIYHNRENKGFRGIIVDISEIKDVEKQLTKSLKEKEVLLQEIHHRVKNNMQIISSFLSLQAGYTESPEAKAVLRDSQNRVKTMAIIHEKLYMVDDFTRLEVSDYLQNMVQSIVNSYSPAPESIELEMSLENVFMNLETALPLGLLVNEMVSNSMKHAFPRSHGKITMNFRSNGGKYVLKVKDDGVGFPEDFNPFKSDSLGFQLIKNLVKQIEGSLEIKNQEGAEFIIEFRELEYKERINNINSVPV